MTSAKYFEFILSVITVGALLWRHETDGFYWNRLEQTSLQGKVEISPWSWIFQQRLAKNQLIRNSWIIFPDSVSNHESRIALILDFDSNQRIENQHFWLLVSNQWIKNRLYLDFVSNQRIKNHLFCVTVSNQWVKNQLFLQLVSISESRITILRHWFETWIMIQLILCQSLLFSLFLTITNTVAELQ